MKKYSLLLLLLNLLLPLHSQNPIVPPGVYIADPSAHVWKDGKLYVYGSRDESPAYYCSWSYHVLSTSDLKTWTIHENSFASKGTGDQVPYSDDYLYAPDVQYKNGTYYLYYCLANNTKTEGVATSSSPVGPFTGGTPIKTGGFNQIDPCVFIDDDGQAYYIWGQMNAKMAKLKPNMVEIDSTTIRENIVTEKEHRFHEGGYMVKRKGIYYFVYAALSIHDMASCISYSTSTSPWGPFKYGGTIINNDHSDPGNWNNHGSLVEFNGQWYVFYHRATHGCYTMRKACLEPITFNTDGSINEVEMTTQGAAGPLSARNKMDAERACLMHGKVMVKACAKDNEELTAIAEGDRAAYKYIDFGNGVSSVTFCVIPGKDGGSIEVAIDRPWSYAPATIEVPGNGDGKTATEIKVPVAPGLKGVHAVWLRFHAKGNDSYGVDWFKFE
ncbi:MAG TPA: family 43 glycosylhydrolase [Bacteroidales bacterium]|nr:family 43 glycosylhydrolase [Bacteroidales bacterium]